MRTFDEIYAIAAGRKGGTEALEALLVRPKSAAELAALPEDRWLAQFTRRRRGSSVAQAITPGPLAAAMAEVTSLTRSATPAVRAV